MTIRITLENGYDLDALRKTGEYLVTDAQNGPIENGSFFVDVTSFAVQGEARTAQRATDVSTGTYYTRAKAGVWTEWLNGVGGPGGGGDGGGNYWEGATVAATAPDFLDPADGYQFDVTGIADEVFSILPGISGQRIHITKVGGDADAVFEANVETGEYALRDIYGNNILGFAVADGQSVLLEWREPQINNGGWYIVSAAPFLTINQTAPGIAGQRPPYDIHFEFAGTPTDAQEVFAYYVAREILWATSFDSLSGGFAKTLPAADSVFEVTLDSVQIGTMTVSSTDGYCQFDLDVDGNTYAVLNVGATLRIVAPTTADATLSDLYVTLGGYLNAYAQ